MSCWWHAVQGCCAGVLVVVGMTILAAGGMLTGVTCLAVGALWLRRSLRLL